MRIGLFAAQTGVVGPSDDRARFRFAGARIELCPQRLELGEALGLFACLVTDVGVLAARGQGIATERSATRFWLSSGLGLGAEYRLSSQLSLGLLLAESVNFTRDEFVFLDPRVSVHDVPLASQSALLGLDWHFD